MIIQTFAKFIKAIISWISKCLRVNPRKNSPPQEEFINNGIKGDCVQIFHYGVYNPVIRQHISILVKHS
jgi:hypothetical protein